MNSKPKYIIISIASAVAFIFIWYLLTDIFHVFKSVVLPSPVKVFNAFITKVTNPNPDGSTLLEHTISSLKLAAFGLGLGSVIGVPLGILMAWNRKFDLFVKPIFDLMRPIPPIGWIPLMLVFFGIGVLSKAVIIFIASFVPCVVNAYSGIKTTNDVHLWVSQTFGASRTTMLFKVAVPSALPMIFTGFRIALAAAWASLVAAEMLAAQKGLGFMIMFNRMMARADNIIVGMLAIGIIGAILSMLLRLVEKKFIKGWIQK